MKSKFFVILAIIALMAIVVALDYSNAQAKAVGKAKPTEAYAGAGCALVCDDDGVPPPSCDEFEWQVDTDPNTAEVSKECSCAGMGYMYSHAKTVGGQDFPWEIWVADSGWWDPTKCNIVYGKGEGDK